ncbi:MAG: MATE family efflux transporter [Bacteroides sp.]|nr:MATE family efflux transporter [Prevotella sp.]MCM1408908.1 MATE family efflux transporter [Treponema brennaborense]MCM1470835.1 MATE family efflux transporter [Bacteroides sp.]
MNSPGFTTTNFRVWVMRKQPANAEQFNKMTETPIPRLIISLAVPTVISMLITSVYNIADTFFVSQLGTSASGAVGIVFSIMAIIQAAGFTLGMGCGSIVSRLLGAQDKQTAAMYASSAFCAALFFGVLLAVPSLLHTDALVRLLGSTDTILPYARDYARIILLGAPIMCASFVMNNVLRAEGHAAFSMAALCSGGLINIALDPLLIFGLHLGTSGAAAATVISQCVSFSVLLSFFVRRKSSVRLRLKSISRSPAPYIMIVQTGLPSLCRQGLACTATVMLNLQSAVYGDAAVAGMSIVTRIIMLVASVMIGIGQGFTPVSGFNYGARLYSRVKEAFWFTVKAGALTLSAAALTLFVWAPQIIALFRDDPLVVSAGAAALRYQACVLPLHAVIVSANMLMQSTGRTLSATFLACNRQGVYFIPLALLLPRFFGLTGVELSQAAADFLSALTAVPYLYVFFKKLPRTVPDLPPHSAA